MTLALVSAFGFAIGAVLGLAAAILKAPPKPYRPMGMSPDEFTHWMATGQRKERP